MAACNKFLSVQRQTANLLALKRMEFDAVVAQASQIPVQLQL